MFCPKIYREPVYRDLYKFSALWAKCSTFTYHVHRALLSKREKGVRSGAQHTVMQQLAESADTLLDLLGIDV